MKSEEIKHIIGRIELKFKKYQYSHNYIYSLLLIFLFLIKNGINVILCKLNIVLSVKNFQQGQKTMLFIEPPQQGYGDILFQIPLFSILKKAGFIIDILIKKNHEAIIEYNPNIRNVFYWNQSGFIQAISQKHNIIIGLGRDTIKSNAIMFFKLFTKKIIPDANLELWRSIFAKNNPSIAWQKIILENLIGNFTTELPKIYFSKKELLLINQKELRNKRRILFIVQANNKLKKYPLWIDVIKNLNSVNDQIFILNAEGDLKNKAIEAEFYILNTQSYRDAILEIAKSDIIIGTEGSLIHIATALQKKIIALEADFSFKKQTFLNNLNNIKILNNHICKQWYDKNKQEIIRLCFLNKNGRVTKGENHCLKNISPISIIKAIKTI